MHWATAESEALEQFQPSRRADGRAARDREGAP
jgi:hypothetical protein